jgi:hypothetical protein
MGLGLEGANAAHGRLINQLPTSLLLAIHARQCWCGGAAPAAATLASPPACQMLSAATPQSP